MTVAPELVRAAIVYGKEDDVGLDRVALGGVQRGQPSQQQGGDQCECAFHGHSLLLVLVLLLDLALVTLFGRLSEPAVL